MTDIEYPGDVPILQLLPKRFDEGVMDLGSPEDHDVQRVEFWIESGHHWDCMRAMGHFIGNCLLRGGVGLEYGLVYDLVSLGLHCFLRLAHALYCRSGRCLAGVAFSV